MSENNQHDAGHNEGHHVNYKKIYFTLVILFLISVAGPELGIRWLTLITAFGIAVVKANLVIQNFMHLKWEKRIMKWMLTTSLILMALMMAGISPDVMNHEGQRWENVAAKEAVERGVEGEEAEEAEVVEVVDVEPGVFNAQSTFNIACAICHGQTGEGNGPAGLALDPRPANFNDAEFWETRDDERIFNVIRDGAASVGGSALMVPWRNSYDDEQIQALADYVINTFRPDGE